MNKMHLSMRMVWVLMIFLAGTTAMAQAATW
jgi:hypothetical protein